MILELAIIALVALLVVKPERLPEIAYFLGKQLSRYQAWYQKWLNTLPKL